MSILKKPRTENSTAAGYADNKIALTKEPLVSNAANLDLRVENQASISSVPHDKSSENVDAGDSRESRDINRPSDIMSSKGKFRCNLLNLKC